MVEAAQDSKHPLDPIARIFDQIERSEASPEIHESEPGTPEAAHHESNHLSPKPPVLTPIDNVSPALLVDSKLRVVWQNQPALTQLWHHTPKLKNGSSQPHIFDLLMNNEFQEKVENWRHWVSFFLRQASRLLPKEELAAHIKLCDDTEHDFLTSIIDQIDLQQTQTLNSQYLDQMLEHGEVVSYRIYASEFKEGCYITFHPYSSDHASPNLNQHYEIKRHFDQVRLQRKPVRRVFSLLSARLNKAEILQTELLPEEYSRLLNALMQKFITTVEKYGGMFDQPDGNGLMAYFFSDQSAGIGMSTIECALDLKSQLGDMSREWKIRKGWLHDIELNFALHRADEFIGTLQTALGDRLSAHGNALFECTQLCRLANDGQIWATKDLVHQMTVEEQKRLRFGIFRKDNHRQVLVNKSFSRLMDLPNIGMNQPEKNIGLATLPVTQIFDRQIG